MWYMIVLNVIDRAYIMDRKNEKGEEIVKSILVAKKKISSIKSSNSNEYLLTERNTINNNPEPNNKELNKYRKKIFDKLGKFKDAKVQLEKEYPSFNSFDEILAYLKFLEEDVFFDNKVGAYIECAKRNKILIDAFLNDMKVWNNVITIAKSGLMRR